MGFFNTMDISATGLTAQRLRMDVISQNLANVDTTKTADGTPYKRKTILMEEKRDVNSFATYLANSMNPATINSVAIGTGVKVSKIVEDQTEGPKKYDPTHPDADADGYVTMPNVDSVTEMVNMISANRSYEANISVLNTSMQMGSKTLEIGK